VQQGTHIGQQIKYWRGVRGLYQAQLAGLLGVDRSLVSHWENGSKPVDSRHTVYDLAKALDVSVADITGNAADKVNPLLAEFHAQAPKIEAALMAAGHMDLTTEPRSIRELLAKADQALTLRSETEYAVLGRMLPGLITELYQHAATGDEETQKLAWVGLARTAFCVAITTKGMGLTSLAWISSLAAQQAAQMTAAPVDLAAAAYCQSQVMLATPHAVGAALNYATKSLNQIEPSSPEDIEMVGMLHLQAALVQTVLDGDGSEHVQEAKRLAEHAGDGTAYRMSFSPENTGVWEMSIALEQRQGAETIALADRVVPDAIRGADRQSRYWIELARGQALEKSYSSAMSSLLRAEHLAPQQVQSRVVVKQLAGFMLRSAQRDVVHGDLGRFAQRVGAAPELETVGGWSSTSGRPD
jgi:transcriptional regulator with XRE-family HTH domain